MIFSDSTFDIRRIFLRCLDDIHLTPVCYLCASFFVVAGNFFGMWGHIYILRKSGGIYLVNFYREVVRSHQIVFGGKVFAKIAAKRMVSLLRLEQNLFYSYILFLYPCNVAMLVKQQQ